MSRYVLLQPAYDFSRTTEHVLLCCGTAEFGVKGERFQAKAELQLRFIPKPRVIFHARANGASSWQSYAALVNRTSLSFSFNGQNMDGFLGRFWSSMPGDILELEWTPEKKPVCLGDMQCKTSISATFHIFNFPDFTGTQSQGIVRASESCQLIGLETEVWRISLQSLPNNATENAWKTIRDEEGCYLTHVAKLERKDGKLFSGAEASEQRDLLNHFLSFSAGYWCPTICEVGMDSNGETTWESFSSPHLDRTAYSWFSPPDPQQLDRLFPVFALRWQQSAQWQRCLRVAIRWYVETNTASNGRLYLDSAIILAQSALEQLAFQYLVIDRKMISPEGYDRLKASDRLRLLFTCLYLPIAIDDATPEILQAAPGLRWRDAAHALTDIRNELVHPSSKRVVAKCLFDAWTLSLWYLELSVLALCGYDDSYISRLSKSMWKHPENVPWIKNIEH